MADGKIVYEVRIDGSNVRSDMNSAKAVINNGVNAISSAVKAQSKKIGSSITSFFNTSGIDVSAILAKITNGFSEITGGAKKLKSSIAPVKSELVKLGSVNLSGLTSVIGRLAALANLPQTASRIIGDTISNYSSSVLSHSHRSGKEFVPYDNYPALLHKGEAVLTAAENQALRGLGGTVGLNSTQKTVITEEKSPVINVNSPPQEVNVSVSLDGYEMAKAMASASSELSRQLNTKLIH